MITRRRVLGGAATLVAGAGVGAVALHVGSRTRDVRGVERVVDGDHVREGAGVNVVRMLGGRAFPLFDPFLLLDQFKSRVRDDFIAGFPWHPHRGFETVTLMVDGVVNHGDSVGNSGAITGGGVQWMTAGRGIIHQEMPDASPQTGALWGYQLWVNLPAAQKMTKPRYQDHAAGDVPLLTLDDARVRLLAGSAGGARGPVDGIAVDPLVFDAALESGARLRHDVPRDHAAFVQVLEGTIDIGGRSIGADQLAVLGAGDVVEARAVNGSARVMVFAGRPIGEPVARRGPFVMNTEAELRQAFEDYRSGRLAG